MSGKAVWMLDDADV